jgi:hypothetical protein
MKLKLLTNIPFRVDKIQLLKRLKITNKKQLTIEFLKLVQEAEEIGKPKALFKKIPITEKGADYTILETIKLTSRVLSVNLEKAEDAYPALATCGLELEAWSKTKTDLLEHFWAEAIKDNILSQTVAAVLKQIGEMYPQGSTSMMTPGSLNDWPLPEQKQLFKLFQHCESKIGVSLTENCLMRPLKTISFLAFHSKEPFQSCQICAKKDCFERRAPFEDGLYERKYLNSL